MRIILAHNRYRSTAPSGENRVVDQEGEALAALGHEVERFERSSDEIEHWSRAKKASLPASMIWSRTAYRDLGTVLREHRPDIVHVHNTFPLLSTSVLYACRDAGVPVVATFHNRRQVCARGDFFRDGSVCRECAGGSKVPAVIHGCYRGSRAATLPLVLSASMQRRSWQSLISAYLFVSHAIRDDFAEMELAEERVFVRHNLVPRRLAVRPTPEPIVCYVGRLDEAKGIPLLMAGWERYCAMSGDPGLRLVVAGGGVLEPELRAWASSRPSVEVLGQVSGAECSELMARSLAVIVPSLVEESFGLAAVEAMSVGVPPIAAGHGGLAEIVTPDIDGVLFQPGDPEALAAAIADVGANPARYEKYGHQAREAYEQRFSPERSLEKLLDIYRFAIANPVGARSKDQVI
jgi:glycosyltransferase involved in cell wall biosynthesis